MNKTTTRLATDQEKEQIVTTILNGIKENYKQHLKTEMSEDEETESFHSLMNDANIFYVEKQLENNKTLKVFSCFFVGKTEDTINPMSQEESKSNPFAHQTVLVCDNGELCPVPMDAQFIFPVESKEDFNAQFSEERVPSAWFKEQN